MFMPFREGLQSSFGGKVRLNDILPAIKASAEAGIRHFEFGGGACYQAPHCYLGEDPFDDMKTIRETVGPDVNLQILTHSISGVTLTTQSPEGLELQAKLMKENGTTWNRNFDYMNDARNLINTGRPIVKSGMHHQVCIALMGLPFYLDKVHTADFYINIGRELLESDLHIDSICLKDASGTTDPKTIYDTVVGLKKIMPPEMLLWQHTHDTASTAVACYMAGVEGGMDGIDLSVRPMAGGTVQPDVRSMAHALKGTGYTLDIDPDKMIGIENMLNELVQEYAFNHTMTTPNPRVLGFPMPGGAIGPNVHMMAKAGILDKYDEVLSEFPVVVKGGGAWTSVTPGSQQYWLQAFNNVMYGRWEEIDPGYGRAVLGYFGKPPLPPDPEVIKIASKQLELPVFDSDPLEAAPKNIEPAKKALKERNLPVSEKNIFLVMAAMVLGKKMELNEGIQFLSGKPKMDIPLKKKEEEKPKKVEPAAPPAAVAPMITGPVTSRCTVTENNVSREFTVTVELLTSSGTAPSPNGPAFEQPVEAMVPSGIPVHSTFAGSVEVSEILVKIGDKVKEGQVVAKVEAMKAQHDIVAPAGGTVSAIHVELGDEVDSSKPILTIT